MLGRHVPHCSGDDGTVAKYPQIKSAVAASFFQHNSESFSIATTLCTPNSLFFGVAIRPVFSCFFPVYSCFHRWPYENLGLAIGAHTHTFCHTLVEDFSNTENGFLFLGLTEGEVLTKKGKA